MFVLLSVPTILAWDFDNTKEHTTPPNPYGKIEIWNAYGLPEWMGGQKLAEYTLTENTDTCLIDCYSEGTAILYEADKLFRTIRFENRNEASADSRIKDVKFFIKEEYIETKNISTFNQNCSWNETNQSESCNPFVNGSYLEYIEKERWIPYDGGIVIPGTYDWRIEVKKNPEDSIDWIVGSFGEEFTEWAWYNTTWKNKRQITNLTGEIVILNVSHADISNDINGIRFTNNNEAVELDFLIIRTVGTYSVVRVDLMEI